MTKTKKNAIQLADTKRYRAIMLVLEDVRKQCEKEKEVLADAQTKVWASKARLDVLSSILDAAAEKSGGPDDA